ncbi:MAG: NUDIX domain-containing protein [Flavobacteriales bacterium]|jgi:8-oxo-dGTP pyrophosphatase MutT (NUDIX family)|nr:NUDIX domain-containing protein [Flavobacteriales bacterium]|tara:strand:+ start:434 stop:895 length:462 start_codon:yes stop_codon:yes gene_type:complete
MSLTKVRKIESVVILPYVKGKILMQLRDAKEGIIFPGQWGFFGGGINDREMPEEAAKRELFEEIRLNPERIDKFNTIEIPELKNHISHAYCCPLSVPIKDIKLLEGTDLGLFSLEEFKTGKLYSSNLNKAFPVIGIPYVVDTIKALFKFINQD